MSLHDRIKEARKNKGLTQEQLGNLIGVAKTTVTGYEKNREPTAAKVGEIADVLGVDVNFLFQDEVKELRDNHATLKEFENIVKKYRELDDLGRMHIDTVLDWETARVSSNDQKEPLEIDKNIVPESYSEPVRYIPFFLKLTSNENGQIAFDDLPINQISIPINREYEDVDYAIRVNGRSLSPVYNDGDTLLVEKKENLSIGETGIFIVRGKILVKKLGRQVLVSVTSEFDKMPLPESITCLGKVIDAIEARSKLPFKVPEIPEEAFVMPDNAQKLALEDLIRRKSHKKA